MMQRTLSSVEVSQKNGKVPPIQVFHRTFQVLKDQEQFFVTLRIGLFALWAATEIIVILVGKGKMPIEHHAVLSLSTLIGLECFSNITCTFAQRITREKIRDVLNAAPSISEQDAMIDAIFADGFDVNDFR